VASASEADSTSSTAPASSAGYARSAAANSSSAKSGATFGEVYTAGGSYTASVAGASASNAGAESAFSYYGQQPFYRLPPDQISAFRASGVDIPQATTDAQALAAIVANQDNPNGPGHAAADAASRRNAEIVAVAVGSRAIVEQRAVLGDVRAEAPSAPSEVPDRPGLGTTESDRPETLTRALSFLPGSSQVAVGMLPVDLAALERGVEQFFGQIATLGDHVSYLEAAQRLAPWLVAVALSTAALETARWRFWKPAPATPVLTSTARGFSTTHPSGTDPFADLS
jgi:hypothetical protein